MAITTGLAITCALVAALSLAAYVMGLRRIERMRPLATIALFCTAMALWQLGVALLYGLRPGASMNVIYGAAFLLLGAISQVAGTFRMRSREREPQRETAPAQLPAGSLATK
jgi:hypothetical protein